MRRAPTPPAAAPRPDPAALWLAALAVAAALIVFRGALGYFFAQDDFTGLARARGIIPALSGPWRYLSGQLYFDLMGRVAGLDPYPYRLASLVLHGVTVVLVFLACRRFVSPAAAAVAAVFFGTHPALYTALYSVSGIGEILSGLLAVTTLLLATTPGRARWLAVPAFAGSLLCKESTLLLPLLLAGVALRPRAADSRPAPARFALPGLLGLLSAVYLASFILRDTFNVRGGVEVTAPYALRMDLTLADNLLTYLGWTIRIAVPMVRSFSDIVDPSVYQDGIALAAVWGIGCAVRDLRRRGWVEGGLLYLLLLLPVLPLAHHTYHYYLYAPLAGAALCAGALAETVAARLAGGHAGARVGLGVLALAGLALTVNAAVLVHRIETYPFVDPELRSDPTVDRARIAGNAIADLRAAGLPPGVSVTFWSPASIGRQRVAGADTTHESYWETNVRSALYDGLAVRVCIPAVRDVRFVRAFEPAGDSVRYAVYLPNGHLRTAAPAELEQVLRTRAAGGTP